MSKLQKLIQELCPKGVVYKPLGEVSNFRRGSFPQPYGNNEWYGGEGAMPFIQVADIDDSMKLVKETKRVISRLAQPMSVFAPKGSIIISLQGSIGKIAVTQYDAYIDRTVAIFQNISNSILLKYFVYQLQSIFDIKKRTARGSTIKTITKEEFTNFEIPVPPIAVQEEIVRILDSYTEFQAKLQAELQAELQARKEQYEFYRNKLLAFDKEGEDTQRLTWMKMSDVLYSIRTGLNPRQFFKLNTPDAHSYYVTIRELNSGKLNFNNSTDRINESARILCNNRSNLELNDVLFSGTGTIGETYVIEKTPYNWNIKEGIYALKPKLHIILPKYLKLILSQSQIKANYTKLAEGGTVKSISMKKLNDFSIPIPPLDEQGRIVSILDKFEAFVNDLQQELPAEIAAVQEQYEYYRNKLLSFQKIKEA